MHIVLAYLGVVLIWTTTPLAIVWSGETDWFYGIAARTALAALIILPIFWLLKKSAFALDKQALKVYLFASLPILGGMTSMYWASQYLPSGWIAIMFALAPVLTGLFAYWLLPNQSLNRRQMLAIFLSLCGLAIVFVPNLQTHLADMQLLAIGMAFISVCFHGLGTVLVKRCGTQLPSLHVVVGALWVSVIGHLIMAPTTLLHMPELLPREAYAILYAASIGSVVGFLLYFYLIKHVDAMKVALIPVITPVFALLIGHYLNQETLGYTTWLGTGFVVIGLILFEWRFRLGRTVRINTSHQP